MNIDNVMTHISHAEDLPFLRTKLFDVNMRLFKSNPSYKALIIHACQVIRKTALTTFEGYKKPHGTSGANLAIPFNIIGVVRNRGSDREYCQIMINPKITKRYGNKVRCESNCGSIRLKEPITIERYDTINLEWFGENGVPCKQFMIGRDQGSLTIQHEVDHNLGVLITDYQS